MLDQRYSRISSNLPAENVIPDDDKGQLSKLLAKLADRSHMETLRRRAYFDHLMRLQAELVNLQEWVQHHGVKIAILFEGRDAAG